MKNWPGFWFLLLCFCLLGVVLLFLWHVARTGYAFGITVCSLSFLLKIFFFLLAAVHCGRIPQAPEKAQRFASAEVVTEHEVQLGRILPEYLCHLVLALLLQPAGVVIIFAAGFFTLHTIKVFVVSLFSLCFPLAKMNKLLKSFSACSVKEPGSMETSAMGKAGFLQASI